MMFFQLSKFFAYRLTDSLSWAKPAFKLTMP